MAQEQKYLPFNYFLLLVTAVKQVQKQKKRNKSKWLREKFVAVFQAAEAAVPIIN